MFLFCLNSPLAQAQTDLAGSFYKEATIVPQTFIPSSDGTLIAVNEQGPKNARTILFVHGFSHNGAVFYKQLTSPELLPFHLVTMDLRGHGSSAKTTDPAAYASHSLYADDIHSVINGMHLDHPVLAGWSFGSVAVLDYVQKYGDSALGGIDLINPTAAPNAAFATGIVDLISAVKAFPDLLSTDTDTSNAGIGEFIEIESGGAAAVDQSLILSGIIAETPRIPRLGNTTLPQLDFGSVLSSIKVPVLLQKGVPDPLTVPSALGEIAQLVKHSTTKLYPGGAHIPYILNAEQFNLDLAEWLLFTVR